MPQDVVITKLLVQAYESITMGTPITEMSSLVELVIENVKSNHQILSKDLKKIGEMKLNDGNKVMISPAT